MGTLVSQNVNFCFSSVRNSRSRNGWGFDLLLIYHVDRVCHQIIGKSNFELVSQTIAESEDVERFVDIRFNQSRVSTHLATQYPKKHLLDEIKLRSFFYICKFSKSCSVKWRELLESLPFDFEDAVA